MKPIKADLLILVVTICWGSSYLFMKLGLDSVEEFNLIALRFGLAFICASAVFFRTLKKTDGITMKYAAILGFILFIIFIFITFGLKTTTTSNAAFLISLTVVFVPLINAVIFKNKLTWKLILSIMLAIIGVGFLTIEIPFSITVGDVLCVLAALFYASHIIIVGIAAPQVNTLQLGIWQLGFAGLYGLLFSLVFETPTVPSTTEGWVAILALSIVCSALGFILQVIAQKYTTPTRTGLIFSLEPVFAALFGYLFISEVMGFTDYIGASLVIAGIVISSIKIEGKDKQLINKERIV